MPVLRHNGKNSIDAYELARLVDAAICLRLPDHIDAAFIEEVGARPGQGVTSMFSFGTSWGILRGVIAAHFIPAKLVRPQRWKSTLRVPADKNAARAAASRLMPQHAHQWTRCKDDGRAEAAMIAWYGLHHGGLSA